GGGGDNHAAVADLSTCFGVERRFVQRQFAIEYTDDGRGTLQRLTSHEFRSRQSLIFRLDLRLFRTLPRSTRAGALLLHLRFETFGIDGEAGFASHPLLLIESEAVRVVQLERRWTRQHPAHSGLGLVLENALRYLERGRVAMLFVFHDAGHALD